MNSTDVNTRLKHPGLSREHRQILSGVSRSFDLSMRLLPRALQAPVALGYLLARATDTVADTSVLGLPERQDLLSLMTEAIASPVSTAGQNRELARLWHRRRSLRRPGNGREVGTLQVVSRG